MNTIKKEQPTIGKLVAEDYRKAEIFRNYGIDFCCGGKRTLSEVCDEKGIDTKTIQSELENLPDMDKTPSSNFNAWSIDFLVDYILKTHHEYIKKAIPFIYECSAKVARVHGDRNPETIEIAELFKEAAEELNIHMKKEENILFPYIKKMYGASTESNQIEAFSSIKSPIHVMELEHEDVGNIFKAIKEKSNNYVPPKNACATFRVTYEKLKEFETDLHQHMHLENNILFPKSLELESRISLKV